MTEDPDIIKTNIACYRALLKLEISDEKRRQATRLLAAASADRQAATASNQPATVFRHA